MAAGGRIIVVLQVDPDIINLKDGLFQGSHSGQLGELRFDCISQLAESRLLFTLLRRRLKIPTRCEPICI